MSQCVRDPKRSVILLILLSAFLFCAAAQAASAAKRKRRSRPSSSQVEEGASAGQPSAPTKREQKPASSKDTTQAIGLDEQIDQTRAQNRILRRSLSQAVKKASLTGTMMFIPNGSVEGLSVDYTSKHAGKVVRGKVRAAGRGAKAKATITASRAK